MSVGTQPADAFAVGSTDIQWQSHETAEGWYWTYHATDGRLLVRGPVHSEYWSAHDALLDEIADRNFGKLAEDEDEQHYIAKRSRR